MPAVSMEDIQHFVSPTSQRSSESGSKTGIYNPKSVTKTEGRPSLALRKCAEKLRKTGREVYPDAA